MGNQEMRKRLASLNFSDKVGILEKLRDRSLSVNRMERLRRVLALCCYFIQNLAYYRAGWTDQKVFPRYKSQFWVTTNGNFLDECVLEWCKLFGDENGEHYWGKIVSDPISFERNLLLALDIGIAEFQTHIEKIRRYRDKFVAHLDSDKVMNIPDLEIAKKAVLFYQKHVISEEAHATDLLGPIPKANPCYDLESLYQRCLGEGHSEYKGTKAT